MYSYLIYAELEDETANYTIRTELAGSFSTLSKASIKVQKKKNKITKRDAKLYVTINNPSKRKISKIKIVVKRKGKTIGTSKIGLSSKKRYSKTVNLKFNLKKQKIKLKSNTKYEYTVYSYIGGKKYSVKGIFKTKK